MGEGRTTRNGIADVLFMHFGVQDAKHLVLRPIMVDIKMLTVQCENISAPFKTTLYTHVQAVSTVDESILLWLGSPLPMHFREKEFGFTAQLTCGKIYYDQHGLRPVIEGLDEERKLRIHHKIQIAVEIDLSTTVCPR